MVSGRQASEMGSRSAETFLGESLQSSKSFMPEEESEGEETGRGLLPRISVSKMPILWAKTKV